MTRLHEIERALRDEERAEAEHDFADAPRPLRATGPVPQGRLMVDDRRSAGAWLALADGACVLDAASGLEHAPAERGRVYAEGEADLTGARARRPAQGGRAEGAALDLRAAAARGVWLPGDGVPRVHAGFDPGAEAHLAGGEPRARSHGSTEARVRAVGDEDDRAAILRQVLALEAEVYEPARRDPPEKLRKAFDDPDGVVVLAERRRGEGWELVGFSMGVPLERVEGVDGVDTDPRRGAGDTLYALTTTLSPKARGLGLGMGVKLASVRAARAMTRPDGSPRYRWISGRNRVGATAAMMRINRRLGADVVATFSGQYGGDGVAAYYRMPVGAPVPAERVGEPAGLIALDDARTLTLRPPTSHDVLRRAGGLYGPWMSPVEPDERWTTPTVERARRLLSALHGELPHVAFARRHQDLTAQVAGSLRPPEEAKGGLSDETRTAGWRGAGQRFFAARRPHAALWSPRPGLFVLHSREPVVDVGGDPLTIARTRHDAAWLAEADRPPAALGPRLLELGFTGGEAAGRRRFFSKELGERHAAEVATAARERGVALGVSRGTLFAALPWDLTDGERATIGKVLEELLR